MSAYFGRSRGVGAVGGTGLNNTLALNLRLEANCSTDKHIIKWVDRGEEEQHLIRKPRLEGSANSLRRDTEESEAIREFSLLQSMLYHSQQITTQYWLTPLLAYMHMGTGSVAEYFSFLRHLDNHLFCTDDAHPLIERSRQFLENSRKQNTLSCDILKESLGTGFPHYWFYKLEFVLWFSEQDKKQDSRWKEFRFTAKNSVEHISPQIPQEVDLQRIENADVRDGFGNLVLVSRSVNSEYGNLPFMEKRARFETHNKNRIDSLKMALVYENERWSDEIALKHRDATRWIAALIPPFLPRPVPADGMSLPRPEACRHCWEVV